MLPKELLSTGKQNDLVTGFYFYGARFYYPAIGRFISEDTSSGSITSPLSLNRYSYVEDNPESFNDPSGNVIAIPFGGQAYSIHPVAPVPMPAPPPAPSQPATPPPSTPASPSNPNYGNSVTTQNTSIQQQKNPFLIGMTNTANQPKKICVPTYSPPGQACGYPGQAGAILVTIGFFGLSALMVAVAVSFPVTLPGSGPVAVGAFGGGMGAAVYDWEEGSNANWEGALNAGKEAWPEAVEWAAQHISEIPTLLPPPGGIIPIP